MRLAYAKRLFDSKPLACHLYVTDNCNLDCSYCSEYDNEVDHPPLESLLAYVDRAADLGCLHVGLQGGEPLLYPHLADVIRRCRSGGMSVSLSTNGFLLEPPVISALEEAGLQAIQVSVDRMTPTESTRKSLKTIARKLEWLRDTPMQVRVAGVLFADTLGECRQVLEAALEAGFASHFRLVHPDPSQAFSVTVGDREQLSSFLEEMMDRKAAGESIHTTWTILNYQRAMLDRQKVDWTCVAGYKYFFISAQGKFWPCSMLRTDLDFLDVTPELLRTYWRKKECQSSCGVYCVVSTSLFLEHPIRFGLDELLARRRQPVLPDLIQIGSPLAPHPLAAAESEA